ncbi:hypothetical protein L5515_005031 [Caenorhabditis briggsae]|uniref:Protein HGH1 homolog n=1 Tax=Caenorhabditis briggsae TaxID=6238 RepID=A0AAE9IRT0_CAEBR|nr:hypothetical protein L3Y34_002198 [Caenorhabditis briggsae]UMM25059.1 hypothetical protein L5515_005031 [Caenorhabditis briggsae]
MTTDLEVNVDDLVKLLSPTMSLIVRRKTMEIVTQLGTPLDGSAGKYFQAQDFALGRAICQLCEATASDRTETLAALTNYTSGSIEAADFVLEHSKCVEIAYTSVVTNALYSSVASRLLVNVSRHFPDRVDQKLKARNADYIGALLAEIKKSVEVGDEDRAKFVGFTLVNLSTLSPIRRYIGGVGENESSPPSTTTTTNRPLPIVCELLTTAKTTEIRECAADILRNLAFDDGLHGSLLDASDEYLCAILAPLMDVNDNLDDEEMGKLPVRLQYYEKERDASDIVRQKLIEALFQLCATKHGRQVLRSKGVYPAMRELDKATEEAESKKERKLLSSQQEHTLHALIGILIRYESEMDVDPELSSIRELGTVEEQEHE